MQLLQDRPGYYDPPGGLLSFDFRVDHLLPAVANMSLSGRLPDLMPHFDLANAQLTQARAWTASRPRAPPLPGALTTAVAWLVVPIAAGRGKTHCA